MQKTLTLVLAAGACLAAAVCAVVLLSDRSERKTKEERQRAWERAEWEAGEKALDASQRKLAEYQAVRKRLEAQKRNPPDVDVDRFLADAGVRGTRHEAAVRTKFLALPAEDRQQAMIVAGWIAFLGREKFVDYNEPSLDGLQTFHSRHKDLFPAP